MKTLREAFTQKYPQYGKLIDDYSSANDLSDADWSDITKLGLSNFVDYLQENKAQSSVKTYCAMLKSVLNTYADEVDLPKDFMKILSVKGCISQNTWLTDDEIKKLIEFEPTTTTERLVRNQFVIECLTLARNSDVRKFTKENIVDNMLVYVSQKTHIKATIPISPIVEKYLDDMEFLDKKVCANTFNKTIRDICRKCGITQNIKLFRNGTDMDGEKWQFISSHTGRRSGCTNLYLRGVDILDISKLAGHSDIKTTIGYIVCPPRITDRVMSYFLKFDEK
jgi:site-specific recombinase XerD